LKLIDQGILKISNGNEKVAILSFHHLGFLATMIIPSNQLIGYFGKSNTKMRMALEEF
jgi:hypothetical protein